ncbi:MAG: right-handed parallel beta-helix repeat-containing protein [Bacteroidales bacterium]|nr:right-handed parallel beta-helix repeat-containing protein [Bacteroidales bacterium]
MAIRIRYIALLSIFMFVVHLAIAGNYVVTTTSDSGEGSLRAALNGVSGSYMGTSTISFNIPTTDAGFDSTTGTWTIILQSTLPYILGNNITIDGTTQTSNQSDRNPNGPEIVIKSTAGLTFAFGVVGPNTMVGRNNTIKGFAIGGFEYAVMLFGAANCTVRDCYIGIQADGRTPFAPSNTYGIGVTGGTYMGYTTDYSHNITITGNIISGNSIAGIALVGAHEVTVTANLIGCDRTGMISVPNSQGVYITSAAHDNVIGGETAAARNILSGNTNAAVVMDGMNVRNNAVKGNYIGIDITGAAPLSNHYGVIIQQRANNNIVGGTTASSRNIISCNSEIGVYIQAADSNRVSANYIGLDRTGTFSFNDAQGVPLQANGVEINSAGRYNIIGGASVGERNIISGNKIYGCIYYGHCSHNNIVGNYIGSDVTGTISIPNATGICVDGSSNRNIMENNLLSGNRSYGLFIVTRATDSNIFRGNYVGCDASGYNPLPNDVGLMLAAYAKGNIIGGESPADRNIFSGNRYAGIEVTDFGCDGNRITGNYIGVDATGNAPLPNENGIIVSALVHNLEVSRNVVSSNRQFGLLITDRADSVMIYSNIIGSSADTLLPLGNGSAGVMLSAGAHDNFIGYNGQGNVIAHNDTSGVMLTDNTTLRNRISQNAIYGNGHAGIDIYPWGATVNDSADLDDGCNRLMNTPVITSAVYDAALDKTVVRGSVDTRNPQRATVELFLAYNPTAAFPEGSIFMASVTPSAQGTWKAVFDDNLTDRILTTTATDAHGNTSEFSPQTTIEAGADLGDDDLAIQQTMASGREVAVVVAPNPTSGAVVVSRLAKNAIIRIYSAQGIDVTPDHLLRPSQNQLVSLNLSSLPTGVYLLVVNTPDGSSCSQKIVKR